MLGSIVVGNQTKIYVNLIFTINTTFTRYCKKVQPLKQSKAFKGWCKTSTNILA